MTQQEPNHVPQSWVADRALICTHENQKGFAAALHTEDALAIVEEHNKTTADLHAANQLINELQEQVSELRDKARGVIHFTTNTEGVTGKYFSHESEYLITSEKPLTDAEAEYLRIIIEPEYARLHSTVTIKTQNGKNSRGATTVRAETYNNRLVQMSIELY